MKNMQATKSPQAQLYPAYCKRCKKLLCETLSSARVYCAKCATWQRPTIEAAESKNGGETAVKRLFSGTLTATQTKGGEHMPQQIHK